MSQPTVCAIMLVNGREAMVKRAIKAFREQTYQNKHLLILDTSIGGIPGVVGVEDIDEYTTGARWSEGADGRSIGALRNRANGLAALARNLSEVIVHWDSDDWSHPRRIEEQVALLQASGKQCVGYRDMLFWRYPEKSLPLGDMPASEYRGAGGYGEAWLYSNPDTSYCVGTSLCYWRSVWEARPFPDLPKAKGGTGEDVEFLKGLDSLGVSSFPSDTADPDYPATKPRMIASIHGSNTQYYGSDLLEKSTSWRRVPEWDSYARERMAL